MTQGSYEAIRKLRADDDLAQFDCGQVALNQFLQKFALPNQNAHTSQTYVCQHANKIVGFYSLVVGSVEQENAAPRITKGMSRHPVPVMILARLAVDQQHQHRGLGRALLKDALLRTAQAAEIAGIRALLVHAKDDVAQKWYLQWEFEASPTDPYHLFLLLKDLKFLIKAK